MIFLIMMIMIISRNQMYHHYSSKSLSLSSSTSGLNVDTKLTMIISGAYGTVYKARDTLSDTIVAIKKVKPPESKIYL